MGAFDTYAGRAACPRCGAIRYVDGQTTFFDPEFGGVLHRRFERGICHPLDARFEDLVQSATENDWWRVSDGPLGDRWTILQGPEAWTPCSCGAQLVLVLTFRVSQDPPLPDMEKSGLLRSVTCSAETLQGTVELVAMDRVDVAAAGVAVTVDFAPVVVGLGPHHERVQALRAALRRHFDL